jgi:membrane protease subunit HflC
MVALAFACTFTVDAREVAVLLAFGAPIRSLEAPGLYARLPWPIQEVVRFDRRARVLDVQASEVLTRDKKNLVVEPFILWRVREPRRFLESFRQAGASVDADLAGAAELRLSDLVSSRIASALGQKDFADLVSADTPSAEMLPTEVRAELAASALDRFGIELLDVRLRHVGLPLQNEQSIYERMRAERSRIANAYRSEGEEKATAIRARADREAAGILAEADREAARIVAEADGAAARLYADAARRDPEFYRFLRNLDASRRILGGGDEEPAGGAPRPLVVLDPSQEPFRVLLEEGRR